MSEPIENSSKFDPLAPLEIQMGAVPADALTDMVEEIADELAFLDDPMDKYQYIIDLGKKLPPFPEIWCTDAYRVRGCQSKVWLRGDVRDDRLYLQATSDAAIVSGVIALLLRAYSGRRLDEITALSADWVQRVGLADALSGGRRNGLNAMIARITDTAAAAQAGA